MSPIARHLSISGRVQGVGFRAWMADRARRVGLRGWVRNRRDGSVEALVIGEPAEVEGLIEASHRGPTLARVDALEETPAVDDGTTRFESRPTA